MLKFIIYSLTSFSQLLFCLLVYYSSKQSATKMAFRVRAGFYAVSTSVVTWTLVQYAYDWSQKLDYQALVLRVGALATVFVALSFNYFTHALTAKKRSIVDYALLLLNTSAIAVILIVPYFNLSYDSDGQVVYNLNYLIYGYISLIPSALITRAIISLFKSAKTKGVPHIKKRQFSVVGKGMLATTTLALIGNFVLPYFLEDNIISTILVAIAPLVFSLTTAYTIFSLKLFNFRKFFVNTLLFGLIFFIQYAFLNLLMHKIIQDNFNSDWRFDVMVVAFSALALPFIYRSTSLIIDTIQRIFNPKIETTGQFEELVRTIDIDKMLSETTKFISNAYNLDNCAILIFSKSEDDDKEEMLWRTNNISSTVPSRSESEQLLAKISNSVIEVNRRVPQVFKDFSLAFGVRHGDLRGAILLGSKIDGRPIYDDERKSMTNIVLDVALALENAFQYEKIKKFNSELEAKIVEATKQLHRKNEKLKALDEAKDEFISMASHQLRTPLTSIKGYISLILDGDMGKITPNQKKILSEAFASSQRMVYLISDLLNVSRLRTGKFMIEESDIYLPDLISEEIEQVKDLALVKNIDLTYIKPKKFPTIKLDDMKIRQVVMNFIDNAIHYTPDGGKIKVSLINKDQKISLTVKDSGIGVPKKEQSKLFTKFYRANNARKARPDGTGLGLFMAKKVITASGGELIFNTIEGKGSTFGFSFKIKK